MHSKITAKLASYGIGHKLLFWLQRVIVDNVLSKSIDITSGVVQGSVLGPMIFILFINDIVDCLDLKAANPTSCCIFADDLKLYTLYESTSVTSSLSTTIQNIETWSNQWQLSINPEKSLLLQVGSTLQDRHKYLICNKLIPPSDSIRDLGITYNSKLNFLEYIDEIVSRAFQRIYLLFRSFVSGNISILTRAFITYVRPLVENCSYIWSPHQIHYIDKIERTQRYFTRRALKCVGLSYVDRLVILNLESLEIRRIKSDLKLCYKILNGLCDLEPAQFFTLAPVSSVTRGHNKKLIKPICHTNGQLNFFTNRVVNVWNSLPPDLVNAKSFSSFTTKLKSHDLTHFCRGGRA